MRLRDIAILVKITERAVQRIVSDLEQSGVVSHVREGRRNRYEIHGNSRLRHTLESHRTVADLIELVGSEVEIPAKTDKQ